MLDDAREFYVPRLKFEPMFSPVAASVALSLPLREGDWPWELSGKLGPTHTT